MVNFLDVARAAIAGKPHRAITLPDGGPYLDRYLLRKLPDNSQLWLHWFHGGGDACYHNHAWDADVWLLWGRQAASHLTQDGRAVTETRVVALNAPAAGGKLDELLRFGGVQRDKTTLNLWPSHYVGRNTWHRIVETDPDTITVLRVLPGRSADWSMLHPPEPDAAPPKLVVRGYATTPDLSTGWTRERIPTAGPDWHIDAPRAPL